jgi:hypothetical protein
MSLSSVGPCPHCQSAMEMTRHKGGLFTCPACACVFKHKYRKWRLILPLVLVMLAIVYNAWSAIGMGVALVAVFLVFVLLQGMPNYRIIEHGVALSTLSPHESIPFFFSHA